MLLLVLLHLYKNRATYRCPVLWKCAPIPLIFIHYFDSTHLFQYTGWFMILWHYVTSYSQYTNVGSVHIGDVAVSVLKIENNLYVRKVVQIMYEQDWCCSLSLSLTHTHTHTHTAPYSTKAPDFSPLNFRAWGHVQEMANESRVRWLGICWCNAASWGHFGDGVCWCHKVWVTPKSALTVP